MNHLSESLLNQYLDLALGAAELRRIEVHLNECPDCSAKLEELRSMNSALMAYQEDPLPRDLTPLILGRLPERQSQAVFRLLLVAQAGVSVGLAFLLLINFHQTGSFQSLVDRLITPWPVLIIKANPLPWPTWSAVIQGQTGWTDRLLSMPEGIASLNRSMNLGILLPARGLDLLLTGLVISVLWILGNTALLTRRKEVRK